MTLRSFLLALTLPLAAQQTCAHRQPAVQIDVRLDSLIAQMTPAERISQLGDCAPAIPRLHLPAYNWWNEGLHGLARNGYATVFPQAIGLAATFDAPLLEAAGDTIATEARAKFNAASSHGRADSLRFGGLTLWSPNINIFRDPRWGRGQETYGEDPFLTATLGTRFVQGLQGNDPFYRKTDATPKHFAAHSGPEEGRDSFNVPATPHDLADTYLPAFHALTQRSAALMCSYNAIDGIPSCANANLLQTRVRDLWHFSGYVVSDCDAVGNIAGYHHLAPDNAHGAAMALRAGTDLDCGNTYNALGESLAQHLVTQAEIDRALHRILLARLRLGLLDDRACSPYSEIPLAANDTPEHRALALRAAEESIVLLRNDGTLPLAPARKIAVIGPTADLLSVLEANYHGTASQPITPLTGLLASFPNASYAQGSTLAAGMLIPIPRSALRASAEPNAPQGLQAEYFATASLAGSPAVTRNLPTLDLDLDRVAPDPRLSPAAYAARWTGVLIPPAVGDYTLSLHIERCWDCTQHDAFRLFLDDKLMLYYAGGTAKELPSSVQFTALDTRLHTLRIELLHTGQDEGITLAWEPPPSALLDEAVQTAMKAETIVAFVGLSPDLEGEALQLHLEGFNGGDRTSLALPAAQLTLLSRLEALHKPMVIVLTSGSAVAIDPEHKANALLAAWYPGEEGGHALANILMGITNPSGRLPLTFYRSVADLPPFTDYSMAHRTYRYFDGPVLFPFGFGLSYTTFTYTGLHLGQAAIHAGDPLTAIVTLTNTGTRAGDEVAELYIMPPTQPGSPRLTLQGMQRVHLAAQESRTLTFSLLPEQLSFVDPAGHRAIRAGDYRLSIGGTQPRMNDPAAILHIQGERAADF